MKQHCPRFERLRPSWSSEGAQCLPARRGLPEVLGADVGRLPRTPGGAAASPWAQPMSLNQGRAARCRPAGGPSGLVGRGTIRLPRPSLASGCSQLLDPSFWHPSEKLFQEAALEHRPAPLEAHGAAGSCSAISGCGGRGPLSAVAPRWLPPSIKVKAKAPASLNKNRNLKLQKQAVQ